MKTLFNPTQQKVFDQLKKFIKHKDINTYILKGYAGTGKTFLIQRFAEYMKKNDIKFKLMATTGRAAAVLKGKTGLDTSTIHSGLYIFSKVDGDHEELTIDSPIDDFGQMKLMFEPVGKMEDNCVFIVDEASMVASQTFFETSYAAFGTGNLLADLLNAVGKNKIIFVGDDKQLPPVGQDFSPALDKKWLDDFGRLTIDGTLDQIMRTDEGNDILELASAVRNAIGLPPPETLPSLPARGRENCVLVGDFHSVFLEYVTRFLLVGSKGAIAITYSNRVCAHLNTSFRRKIFKNTSDILVKGEILMVNQNNYLIPLTNGDFVEVTELGELSMRCGLRFQNVRVKHLLTGEDYEIKLALDPLLSRMPNLTVDQQRLLMIDFSKRMRKAGMKPNSDDYRDAMQHDPYLNSLRATYGYVVTCHKAQGGEWDEVFLFLDKGMYAYKDSDTMQKWWYTAITRAKKTLYLHEDWWIV